MRKCKKIANKNNDKLYTLEDEYGNIIDCWHKLNCSCKSSCAAWNCDEENNKIYCNAFPQMGASCICDIIIPNEVSQKKNNIDSFFGVCKYPANETEEGVIYERCICITDKNTWKKEQRALDIYVDDSYSVLEDNSFGEEMENVFVPYKGKEKLSDEEIKKELVQLGFEYNIDFENFMNRCLSNL